MANNIVTTNQQLDQIVVYSNNWATSNIYASTNGPVAVAIDSKGNIWAAGNGRASGLPDYVTKHPVGNFSNITNYACQENLNAICIDADDNVWATSSEGYLVLDASNSYAMTEYTIGLCRGVCVNQDNVIFVTLTNSDEVRSNPFISGIDSPGIDPKGICCDQNNDIWVANTGNDGGKYYVTRLDSSNGYSATKFEVDTPPQAVAVDKNNNIWASGASKIYKLDASNSYAVTSYAAIPISGGSDLCVDDNNNIWISYYGEDKVSKFDASNFYARTDYDGETGGNFIDSGIAAHYLYQDIDVSSEGYTSSSSTSSSSSSSKSSSSSSSKSSLSSESSNVCWAIGDIGIYITDVATLSSDSSSVEFSSSSDSSISSSSSSSSSKSSSSSSSSSHSSSSSSSSSLGYSSSSSSSSSSYSSSYSSSSHSSSSSSSSSKSSSSSSSSSKSSSSYSSSSKSSSSSSSSSKSSSSSSSSSIGFSSLSSSSSSSSSSVGFTSSSDSSSVGFTSSSDSSSYEETRFRVVTTVANQTFGFTADSATDLVINWGDGTDSTINGSNSASRTYAAAGTYYVSMVGACTRFAVTTGPTLLKEILTPIVGIDGITSCFNTFRQCSALTSLPTDLFRYLTGVTTFQECFLQCSGLTSLPSGLFQYNTVCTSFRQAFYQCSNITALPADLFKYVANNCLFVQTFVACNKIVTIGSGCFDNKIGGDSGWYQCFQNCSALTTIPANLFQHVTSTNNYMFLQTFINCTSLVSIPATLFSGSGGAYQAFYGTFQGCTKLASIPSGLFDTATSASTQAFNNTFSGCTLLESVPSNLFVNNTSCTGWNSCFYNCRKLTMVYDLFYDQADRDTRFAGKTVDFTNFFRLTAASTALSAGTAPDLWNASGTLTGTTAFTGHTTSSLDNYNDIPSTWGGAAIWTPKNITTALWYDSAYDYMFTLDGTAVTQWNDKSGNSQHISQSNATYKPSYSGDGLVFNADCLFRTLSSTLAQPFTSFALVEYSGANTDGQYIHDSSGGRIILGESGSTGWGIHAGTWLKSTGLSPTTISIHAGIYDGTSSAVYTNGTSVLSGNAGTGSRSGSITVGAATSTGGTGLNGKIYELIHVADVTENTRQLVEGYLAWKWDGIHGNSTLVDALPVGHPYKSSAPTA